MDFLASFSVDRVGPIIPGEIHELDTESNSRIVYLEENVKIKATIFSSLRCNGGEFPRRYPAISFPPDEGRIALRVWRALGIRFRRALELFELFEVQIKSSLVSRRLVTTLRVRCRFAWSERVSQSDFVRNYKSSFKT